MNKTSLLLAAAAVVALTSVGASAASQTVNVDGFTQAGDGSVGEDVFLVAGSYQLSFIDIVGGGAYTAFSRFAISSACTNGALCETGWENSVNYIIDGVTFAFGDGNGSFGIGPISGGGYFETDTDSFANSAGYTQNFTLNTDTTVRFYLQDNILDDNRGGVSLSVAAVPLPAAAWLFGSALLGLAGVARRKRA